MLAFNCRFQRQQDNYEEIRPVCNDFALFTFLLGFINYLYFIVKCAVFEKASPLGTVMCDFLQLPLHYVNVCLFLRLKIPQETQPYRGETSLKS